jgi:DNA-binding MarR family transcriptional regulator
MATILEKKGFVALERDKSDARILRVSLTDKCTDYLAKRSKLENQFIERLFLEIDEEIINKTSIGISALLNNVIEMENEISQEKG